MTFTDNVKSIAGFTVFVAQEAPAAARYHHQVAKQRKAQKRYDKKIAKMQKNIGEYKPATIPVQVWA